MHHGEVLESSGDNPAQPFPADQDMPQPDSGQPFFLKKIALQRKQFDEEDMNLPPQSCSIDQAGIQDHSASPLEGKAELPSPSDEPPVQRVKSMKEVPQNEALSPTPLVKQQSQKVGTGVSKQ